MLVFKAFTDSIDIRPVRPPDNGYYYKLSNSVNEYASNFVENINPEEDNKGNK